MGMTNKPNMKGPRKTFSKASGGSSEAYVSGDSNQGINAAAAAHSTSFFGGFGGHGK